jgi:CheY-like chemotaxis protein
MPVMAGSQLAQEIKYLVPDVPVVLLSSRADLPAAELAFVDAHFGFGTSLDDLLWTMRFLAQPKVMRMAGQRADESGMTQWADST